MVPHIAVILALNLSTRTSTIRRNGTRPETSTTLWHPGRCSTKSIWTCQPPSTTMRDRLLGCKHFCFLSFLWSPQWDLFFSVADSFARPKKIAYWGAGGLTSQIMRIILLMISLLLMMIFRSDHPDNHDDDNDDDDDDGNLQVWPS